MNVRPLDMRTFFFFFFPKKYVLLPLFEQSDI